jgi:hypothetical protein
MDWHIKNKKILLIDGDSTIPNLAIMQMSTWFKSQGNQVDFAKAGVSYYPNKRGKIVHFDTQQYDAALCSVIFNGTRECIRGDGIIWGGTGYDLTTELPYVTGQCEPDYSIYPDNNISYGFLTRGCSRKCTFCVVPQKEGKTRGDQELDRIVKHDKVKFLDNNILSWPKHKRVMAELVRRQTPCQFMQGLDVRLLDDENSKLLGQMNYTGDYIFAFDSWKYRKAVDRKLDLVSWRKPWRFKFYVYVNPAMDLFDHVARIEWLKSRECLPYVMRDQECWGSKYQDFYTDLASWCNQPGFFKKLTFSQFLVKRCEAGSINQDRVKSHTDLYALHLRKYHEQFN